MNNLSRLFGKHLKDDFYAFPQANVLAALSEKEIKKAKVGFRGKYMIKTARQILEKGGCKVYFQSLESHKSEEIHKKLKELPGVGNKIADCVLLFAFNRLERVPIDVWTRRILKHAFDINLQSKYTNLQNDAQNIFGKYSGYAFSFLFEYVRKYGKQSLSA
jgi:N-glycosylase/DNA lyase